jgi:primase-polymerase (primpol)-like protein
MRPADTALAAVPVELRREAQWVTWRSERRDGHLTKVPYCPVNGTRASTADRSTWATFDVAMAAWRRDGHAGIGFVFSEGDPYCGVDLDDCLDDQGAPSPEARRVVQLLDTYTEISPSGRGLKLFLKGRLPAGGHRRGKVEMYDRGRYFTVTGRHLPGTPAAIGDRQRELEALHAEIFPPPPRHRPRRRSPVRCTGDDAQLLARARSAKNGRKFMALFYRGDLSFYRGDDSAADLALCCLLAFWCGSDRERIDRLFRQSALMREKWDSRRGDTTYGERTLDAALRRGHG